LHEFTNNTNGNKIQNAKIKIQNDNSKLKINKIQIPVIARSRATKQSLIYLVIASADASARSNLFE